MPRTDDSTIGNDALLWRRILPSWVYRAPGSPPRPESVAFIDRTPSGEVSVHLASIMKDPAIALKGRPDDSLAAITAGQVRALGCAVVRDPTPEDPSHAVICPSPTKGNARKLAQAAGWVVLRDSPSA